MNRLGIKKITSARKKRISKGTIDLMKSRQTDRHECSNSDIDLPREFTHHQKPFYAYLSMALRSTSISYAQGQIDV